MPNGVNVGLITPNGQLQGFNGADDQRVMMQLMESNFNVDVLRTNDVLRKDEWISYDTTVVEIARQRLVGVQDLFTAGLTMNIPNALGVTRVEWEKVSDMTGAEVNMSGLTESRGDRVTYDLEGIPLPIIHKDFSINIRALHASRKTGMPLDTTQAAVAARKVSEAVESMLWDGYSAIKMQNSTIYGYTTHPDRTTGSIAAADWDATPDGGNIVADVLEMIQSAYDNKMYGPYILYVPLTYFVNMGQDFKANSDKSILQRVKEIPGIRDVKPSENISGEVVLVQLTRDVVDMIDGIQPTTVMWTSHGGMVFNFKVLAIMAPRIKSDGLAQSGIVHFTAS